MLAAVHWTAQHTILHGRDAIRRADAEPHDTNRESYRLRPYSQRALRRLHRGWADGAFLQSRDARLEKKRLPVPGAPKAAFPLVRISLGDRPGSSVAGAGGGHVQVALLRTLPTKHLSVETVPDLAPQRPDDLVLRVDACGICGTDLHILSGHSYRPDLPFVLGHEPVGVVVEAGQAARERWVGRRVTLTLFTGCGECRECLQGQERICSRLRSISGVLNKWGGYAEYMMIHAAQAIEPPSSLSDAEVASLVDSGATAANAVRVVLSYGPHRVAIVGAGPVGVIASEMLRAEGVGVEVVQPSEPRQSAMRNLGYPTVATLQELHETPDVVIDCAGSSEVPSASVDALAPRGLYVAAGYATLPSFDFARVARKELELRGIRSGSRSDLVRVLDLAASGRIRLPPVICWPLSEINEAFDALRARRVPGKAIISPKGKA